MDVARFPISLGKLLEELNRDGIRGADVIIPCTKESRKRTAGFQNFRRKQRLSPGSQCNEIGVTLHWEGVGPTDQDGHAARAVITADADAEAGG